MRVPTFSRPLLDGHRGSLIAVGLLLVALMFAWLGVVAPLTGWYRARAEALAERRSVLQHMEGLVASLPALSTEGARIALPPEMLIGGDSDAVAAALLQSRVEELAQRVDAHLASVAFLPGKPIGSWRRIGLRIAMSAPYSVLVRLLQSLQNTTPAMTIDDLSLLMPIAVSIPGNPKTMDAQLTVYAFRRATPEGHVHPGSEEALAQ